MNARIWIIVGAAIIAWLGGTADVQAQDGIFLETGQGFYFSNDTEALILRYQRTAPPLFGLEGFYEAMGASWNGPNEATAAGLARGVRWPGPEQHSSLGLTAGLCHISRVTANLGQPFQFYGRFAAEERINSTLVSVAWFHLSDAKFLFNWSGRNNSENFLTLSVGLLF